jgi:hypothetical protein
MATVRTGTIEIANQRLKLLWLPHLSVFGGYDLQRVLSKLRISL